MAGELGLSATTLRVLKQKKSNFLLLLKSCLT